MVQRKIVLRPEDVGEFVSVASKCDFEIDIFYNSYIVDAKSILGVYGLDFSKTLTVRYSGYDAELEQYLTKLAAAS